MKELTHHLASVIASENLKKPDISAYINVVFDRSGLLKQQVDIELSFVVRQLVNLGAKIRAIDIYYKKVGAYTPKK